MKTSEIAAFVGGELVGDGDVEISSAAGVVVAGTGQITFIDGRELPEVIRASCVLISEETEPAAGVSNIRVKRPKLAFARVAALLHPPKTREPQVHSTAVISPDARIGTGVFLVTRRLTPV